MFALLARPRLQNLLTVLAVLLLLASSVSAAAPAMAKRQPMVFYVGRLFTTFTPIDPMTLRDDTSRPTVELDSVKDDFVLISADGSTQVVMGYDGEVAVYDGLDGAERVRFSIDDTGWAEASGVPEALSTDGTRLVVGGGIYLPDRNLYGPAWRVFDTRSGRLIATVLSEEQGLNRVVVDAGATRLYRLLGVGMPEDLDERTGPATARLIAHDLTTGEEIGRLDLPDVRLGTWRTGAEWKQIAPALALSPDGERIAIVHADSDAMTIVATANLTVDRTIALTTPRSWKSRLLGLLPLAPQGASAKVSEGTFKAAVFSPDGNRLYMSGTEWTAEDEPDDIPSLGLWVIEVATGAIMGKALDDVFIDRMVPALDGQSVYATTSDVYRKPAGHSWNLLRLDAETLDVQAERTFSSYPWLLMMPETAVENEPS